MSKLIETQAEFQRLAMERLDEAAALVAAGKWGGAYYLAGYAVELALKSCIIKRLLATDAFPKKAFSTDCYTHDLNRLVELAGLEMAFEGARKTDIGLNSNWEVAKDCSEIKRYHLIAEAEARSLLDAVSDGSHGVLLWIKTCW